jgi:hypothetical protein
VCALTRPRKQTRDFPELSFFLFVPSFNSLRVAPGQV